MKSFQKVAYLFCIVAGYECTRESIRVHVYYTSAYMGRRCVVVGIIAAATAVFLFVDSAAGCPLILCWFRLAIITA